MTAASQFEPWPGIGLARQLEEEKVSPAESDLIQSIAENCRHGSAINPNYVRTYLRHAGCSETPGNIERARRVVAVAYREACIEAAIVLGEPDPRNQLPPIPRALRAMIGEDILSRRTISEEQTTLSPSPTMGSEATPISMPASTRATPVT